MDEHAGADIMLFGGFRFDRRRGSLSRQNESGGLVPVAIGSRALEILGLLIDRHGDLVSRDEILDTVWPGVVEGANVTVQISALRRALDDGRSDESLIQTIPGRGYRLVAPVTRCDAEPPPKPGGDENRIADEIALASGTPVPRVPIAASRRQSGTGLAIAAASLVVLVLAAGAWRLWLIERTAAVQRFAAAASNPLSLAAPRLSIVVLPFVNLSNDPDQQYFADGITDDLTTDLSRIAHSFVISRNTAFTYQNRPVGTKQIGRELGVRYVLEGSVRRSGNEVRINAQLIDAETDAQLWAEHLDGNMGDRFALQNEITGRIAVALKMELLGAGAARPAEHPGAVDYILRGGAASLKTISRARYTEAIPLFEHALALDPQSVEAQSELANMLAQRVGSAMSDSRAADIARAEGLVGQALAASPRSRLALYAKAQVLRMGRDRCREALPEYQAALAFDRNSTGALNSLGQCKLLTGSSEEVIPLMEQAIRLSPRDPQIGLWYWQIGRIHLLQSHVEEAIAWLEKARSPIAGT